jgi:predicted DNA-binding protein YlxM (UPF0122 family)
MIYVFIFGFLSGALFITFLALTNVAKEREEYTQAFQKLRLSMHRVATERPVTEKTQADCLIRLVEQVDSIEAVLEGAKGAQNIAIIRDLVEIKSHLSTLHHILKTVKKDIGLIGAAAEMMVQD